MICGVPPVHFGATALLLYDLKSVSDLFEPIMFADDTNLFHYNENI